MINIRFFTIIIILITLISNQLKFIDNNDFKVTEIPAITNCLSGPFFARSDSGDTIHCQSIKIGCTMSLSGKFIIENEKDYGNLLNENKAPIHDCNNYQLPEIDFRNNILVGYISSIYGCQIPIINKHIIKNKNKIKITIEITPKGNCEMRNPIRLWCLIPYSGSKPEIFFDIQKK